MLLWKRPSLCLQFPPNSEFKGWVSRFQGYKAPEVTVHLHSPPYPHPVTIKFFHPALAHRRLAEDSRLSRRSFEWACFITCLSFYLKSLIYSWGKSGSFAKEPAKNITEAWWRRTWCKSRRRIPTSGKRKFPGLSNYSAAIQKFLSLSYTRAANCTKTLLPLHPKLCSRPFPNTTFVTIAYLFPYSL